VININIDDATEMREFMRDLRAMDREVAKELNSNLRDVLRREVVPAAQRNASWSSQIPRAIKPMVQARRLGVRVNARQARHARPYEGLQAGLRPRSGGFRHPLFGNRNQWFTQAFRPFLAPAMLDNADRAAEGVLEALDTAARKARFS
jgi:hypothetical protein